jgi:hypothetical protein
MGSPAVAALLAHASFCVLVIYGFAVGELNLKRLGMFVLLWLVGLLALPYVPYEPAHAMFSPFVAVLDIALVFTIFKRDVTLI